MQIWIKFSIKQVLVLIFCSILFMISGQNIVAEEVHVNKEISWQLLMDNIKKSAPNAMLSNTHLSSKNFLRLADGSYKDLDYDSRIKSSWPAFYHLTRLQGDIQVQYWQNDSDKFEKEIPKYLKSFNYYLDKDPMSDNWWFNQIGAPRHVALIAIYLYDYLSKEELVKVVNILNRSKITMTGQNRIWLSSNVFYRGVLTKNKVLIIAALKNILEELKIGNKTEEGVQSDYSFHQHGPQQQFGNYGLAYTETMTYWFSVLKNTSLFPSKKQLEVLRDFMLKGQSWVCFNGYMDPGSCGRQFVPDTMKHKVNRLLNCYKKMVKIDKKYSTEYEKFINDNKKKELNNSLSGNRYFYRSDYMIHRRENFILSLKMSSNRVIGAEAGNGENLKGYHLGDGVSWLMNRNCEWYSNIFPVMNWRLLPGATIPQSEGDLPVLNWSGYRNQSDFVGGVSDGKFGFAAMDFNRDGVTGLKSYFFFNDEAVFLGANLQDKKGRKLSTTVQQCLVDKINVIKRKYNVIEAGNVAYINLKNEDEFIFKIHNQSGSWQDIYRFGSSPEIFKKQVLTIKYDHNKKINNYSYAIINEFSKQSYYNDNNKLINKKLPFKVIANKSTVQGVYYSPNNSVKVVQLVFVKAQKIDTPFGMISVDKPCLLMIKENVNSKILTISDPTQKINSSITVSIDGKLFIINLPKGNYTGKSVTVKLSGNL